MPAPDSSPSASPPGRDHARASRPETSRHTRRRKGRLSRGGRSDEARAAQGNCLATSMTSRDRAPSVRRTLRILGLAVAVSLLTVRAFAQQTPPSATVGQSLVPPKLVHEEPAKYPEGASGEATVVVEIL